MERPRNLDRRDELHRVAPGGRQGTKTQGSKTPDSSKPALEVRIQGGTCASTCGRRRAVVNRDDVRYAGAWRTGRGAGNDDGSVPASQAAFTSSGASRFRDDFS